MPKIKTIYIVFKTHFDIGFTKLAAEIVENYAQNMLPAVVETCEQTQIFGEKQQYVWTMSSWPLVQSLNPEIADEAHIKKAKELIRQKQISWHILPFTTHTEFCGLEEFIRGLYFSKRLSDEYRQWPIAAKMTDVPGHTWILPSILHQAGVKFLHLGCNPGSTPPAVPRLFFWEGPDGNKVLTFYSKGLYGSKLIPPEDWPFPIWLALQQTGDNIGPQKPEIIQNIIDEVNREMPGTEVVVGTMDDFYRSLADYPLDNIPVIRGDLADSWIHGVGTYPNEVKDLRALRPKLVETEKALSSSVISGLVDESQKVKYQSSLSEAYEKSILFGEHTWGLDTKIGLGYQRHYHKKEFLEDKNLPHNLQMEKSWDEQRERVALASQSLENILPEILNKLATAVSLHGPRIIVFNGLGWKRDAWVDLTDYQAELRNKSMVHPENGERIDPITINGRLRAYFRGLPALGYQTYLIDDSEKSNLFEHEIFVDMISGRIENQWYKIELDTENGTIRSLHDKVRGKEWVDQTAGVGFGQYRYDIYGDEDITEFIRAYGYRFYDWFVNDFGKMGYPAQNHCTFIPRGFSLDSDIGRDYIFVIMRTEINDQSIKDYGNGSELITRVTLYRDQPWIDFQFTLNRKEEIQLVEAGHFVFPINLKNPEININKLGSVINPSKDIVTAANHMLYCCENWVDLSDDDHGIAVIPYDTPLFSIGDQAIYQYRKQYQPGDPTLFFNAFNNSWGTNFPQWMGGDYSFKYRLIPHDGNWKQGQIPKLAFESLSEPLIGFASEDGESGLNLPTVQDWLHAPEGFVIQAFKPAENGDGFIIRLREFSGEANKVVMTIDERFKSVCRCDLLERIQYEIPIENGEIHFSSNSFEIHTLYLK